MAQTQELEKEVEPLLGKKIELKEELKKSFLPFIKLAEVIKKHPENIELRDVLTRTTSVDLDWFLHGLKIQERQIPVEQKQAVRACIECLPEEKSSALKKKYKFILDKLEIIPRQEQISNIAQEKKLTKKSYEKVCSFLDDEKTKTEAELGALSALHQKLQEKPKRFFFFWSFEGRLCRKLDKLFPKQSNGSRQKLKLLSIPINPISQSVESEKMTQKGLQKEETLEKKELTLDEVLQQADSQERVEGEKGEGQELSVDDILRQYEEENEDRRD